MAQVVDVLDDLFGLTVTSCAVDVLEGQQCAPGDVLCRPHYPLESLTVVGGAIAVPGGYIARQDALGLCICKRCVKEVFLVTSQISSGS